MSSGPEFEKVENPFIDQLVSMGWKHTTGNLDHPEVSGRTNFREVILEQDLRRMMQKINVDDEGKPWLDDSRISTAISTLTRLQSQSLLETNEKATELLMGGVAVEGGLEIFGGREPTAHFVDWENSENNEYRVINQFRVDEPGSHAKNYIIPDLVLFINGIPIGVVECKKPGADHKHSKAQGIPEAINQLRRYSNQRDYIEGDEGNEELFYTNQLLIATCYNYACVGTITSVSSYKYFLEWKDTSPVPMSEVAEFLNKTQLSSQEKLVAGMLRPAHLIDIIRHFTLFMESEGRKIKIVCRYQQFRAVHASIHRLMNGKTILEDTEKPPQDRRGGIIWHTQGSGKSLTMVFLVRKMRSTSELQGFKIIVVTDRTTLQRQLSKTLDLSGDVVQIAKNTNDLKSKLSDKTPNVAFAMIQKYRQQSADDDDQETEDTGSSIGQEVEEFPELNDSTKVLILVDEAHRSHGIDAKSLTQGLSEDGKNNKSLPLHMNLRLALPNAAMIGFTGTPIIMRAKKKTVDIFGKYIDTYTIRESEEDGATVRILYEGRTSEGAVEDGQDLDRVFEDFFKDMTSDELEALKQKYATKGKVQEAEELIAAKAKDMLYHYIGNIMPNGFKAQVVAYSRRATVRFYDAFVAARDELAEKLENLPATIQDIEAQLDTLQPPSDGSGSEDRLKALQAYKQKHMSLQAELEFLPKAQPHLAQIRALTFAPVISDGKVGNDDPPPSWAQWTKKSNIHDHIRRFKKKLGLVEDETQSPLAFLIVKSMLLTGFDAPIEQVMYLDRPIKEAELLQAIARVNRAGPEKKKVGIVVDYYGVANHLKKALEAYDAADVDGAMRKLKDELPKLRDASLLARKIFTDRDIETSSLEECIQLLADEKLRAEFFVKFKQFLAVLDVVLPRPEAKDYVPVARELGLINTQTRLRYREPGPVIDPADGAKVADLIDEHLRSQGIDPKIPPINILDAKFGDHIKGMTSARARASEMEHALRYHIRQNIDKDPVYYKTLSERLEEILKELKDQWDKLTRQLEEFIKEVVAGRQEDETGLDPKTQAPFYDMLCHTLVGKDKPTEEQQQKLIDLTIELVEHIKQEIKRVNFWNNVNAQEVLRSDIFERMDDVDLFPFDKLEATADKLVELAKRNRHYLEN